MDHYAVLGVRPDASPTEVRRAYLAAARVHHPDANAGDTDAGRRADAEASMRQVNDAWAVLGDAARRRRYDDELAAARRAAWRPGTVAPDFVPLDDGEDPDDPAAEHDLPYGDGTPIPRSLQVGPAAVLVLGLVALGFGALLGFRPLLALGLVGVVGSALLFVATPVSAILRSNRHSD